MVPSHCGARKRHCWHDCAPLLAESSVSVVDQSYRSEFRELFQANFGQVRAEMAALRTELKAELRAELQSLRAELDQKLARQKTALVVWMFGFWIGAVATIIGALVALGRLGVLIAN